MRVTLLLAALTTFTGCEAFIPSGKPIPAPKPAPTPAPTSQEIVLRILVDGQGQINLSGAGDVIVSAAQNAATKTSCGCGCTDANCDCNLSPGTTGSPVDAQAGRGSVDPQPVRREVAVASKPVVTLYAPDWCQACKPIKAALAARTDLPFAVVIKGEADGVQSFPTLRWTRKDGAVMTFDSATWISVDNVVNGWRANQ